MSGRYPEPDAFGYTAVAIATEQGLHASPVQMCAVWHVAQQRRAITLASAHSAAHGTSLSSHVAIWLHSQSPASCRASFSAEPGLPSLPCVPVRSGTSRPAGQPSTTCTSSLATSVRRYRKYASKSPSRGDVLYSIPQGHQRPSSTYMIQRTFIYGTAHAGGPCKARAAGGAVTIERTTHLNSEVAA